MINTNPLPDLARSFRRLTLMEAMASAPGRSLFADTVRASAYSDTTECALMIRDQLKDNRLMVIDEVGEWAVTIVEELYK